MSDQAPASPQGGLISLLKDLVGRFEMVRHQFLSYCFFAAIALFIFGYVFGLQIDKETPAVERVLLRGTQVLLSLSAVLVLLGGFWYGFHMPSSERELNFAKQTRELCRHHDRSLRRPPDRS